MYILVMTIILLRMETIILMFLSQVLVVRSTSEEARSPECTAPGKGDRFHTNYHERPKKEDKSGKKIRIGPKMRETQILPF